MSFGDDTLDPSNVVPHGPMIERVARAICPSHNLNPDTDWESCETVARTAIAAMREPTEAMLNVHADQWRKAMANSWRAMIDAALEEK